MGNENFKILIDIIAAVSFLVKLLTFKSNKNE